MTFKELENLTSERGNIAELIAQLLFYKFNQAHEKESLFQWLYNWFKRGDGWHEYILLSLKNLVEKADKITINFTFSEDIPQELQQIYSLALNKNLSEQEKIIFSENIIDNVVLQVPPPKKKLGFRREKEPEFFRVIVNLEGFFEHVIIWFTKNQHNLFNRVFPPIKLHPNQVNYMLPLFMQIENLSNDVLSKVFQASIDGKNIQVSNFCIKRMKMPIISRLLSDYINNSSYENDIYLIRLVKPLLELYSESASIINDFINKFVNTLHPSISSSGTNIDCLIKLIYIVKKSKIQDKAKMKLLEPIFKKLTQYNDVSTFSCITTCSQLLTQETIKFMIIKFLSRIKTNHNLCTSDLVQCFTELLSLYRNPSDIINYLLEMPSFISFPPISHYIYLEIFIDLYIKANTNSETMLKRINCKYSALKEGGDKLFESSSEWQPIARDLRDHAWNVLLAELRNLNSDEAKIILIEHAKTLEIFKNALTKTCFWGQGLTSQLETLLKEVKAHAKNSEDYYDTYSIYLKKRI